MIFLKSKIQKEINVCNRMIFIGTIIYILFYSPLFSQNNNVIVNGYVSDKLTGEKVVGAAILADGIGIALSDSAGFFHFRLSPGKYKITLQMIGYDKITKEINLIKEEQEKEIFFSLIPKPILMNNVTVTGEEFKEFEDYKTYELLNGELNNIPVFLESDALRALQVLPGVSLSHDFSNLIFLRGGNFDETMVSLDEVPIYNASHLGGLFGNFPSEIVNKVKLYPSNYPIEYGGYLSGVVDVQTKKGNSERLKGSISAGLLSSKAYAEVPLWKGSAIFSVRRTYLDLLAKLFDDLGYYFYDMYGKITLPLNKSNVLTISGFYSKDTYKLFENTLNKKEILYKNDDANWGNSFFKLSYLTLFDKFSLTAETYYSRSFLKGDAAARNVNTVNTGDGESETIYGEKEFLYVNNFIDDFSASLKSEYNFTGNNLTAGLSYRNLSIGNNWNINEKELSSTIDGKIPEVFYDFAPDSVKFSDKSQVYSAFISDKIILTPKLNINLGYRTSFINKLKANVHSFNLKTNYKLNDDISISLSYGRYFQYFRTNKEILNSSIFAPFASYFFADDKSNISKSDHYSIGFTSKNIFKNYRLELEAYYKNRKSLPSINFRTKDLDFINGYSAGFDALLKKEIGWLKGWISYSFVRSVKNGTEYNYFANYDRSHTFKILLDMEPFENWELNSFWIYSTGLPYTPIIGKYIGKNLIDWEIIYGVKNSARYGDFHRLDLGLTKTFLWGKLLTKLSIQVMNVYNSKNPFNYEPQASDTDSKNVGEKASYPIPTIGITLEF